MPRLLRLLDACLLLALGLSCSPTASAFSFGSGTCEASADGSFMLPPKFHHPGEHGGFALRFSRGDYLRGETLRVTLAHAGGEVFTGFLLYAETDALVREGLFAPVPGTTLLGALPVECSTESAAMGPTITHDQPNAPEPVRQRLALAWTAPAVGVGELTFRALVLRADPMAQSGTDFYEVTARLPLSVDGVFRDAFESVP